MAPYHSGHQLVDPQIIFQKSQLQPGMHVADFGCGRTGHIVFPATRILGEQGLVYAVDILKDVLKSIQSRAASSGIHSIHTVWSNLEQVGKTAILPKSLDLIFVVNTLTQSDNRHGILQEAHRLLKPKARLVIVDWAKRGIQFGPSDDRYVDFDDITRWSQMHGFVLQEDFPVGQYHRGLIFFKQD